MFSNKYIVTIEVRQTRILAADTRTATLSPLKFAQVLHKYSSY